jgi:hypothetical protein
MYRIFLFLSRLIQKARELLLEEKEIFVYRGLARTVVPYRKITLTPLPCVTVRDYHRGLVSFDRLNDAAAHLEDGLW